MALITVTYSAGRRAGLTESLHIWTRPDRGSREGYWLGKLSKTCFLLKKCNSGNSVCMTFSGRVGSTFWPVFLPRNTPLTQKR